MSFEEEKVVSLKLKTHERVQLLSLVGHKTRRSFCCMFVLLLACVRQCVVFVCKLVVMVRREE